MKNDGIATAAWVLCQSDFDFVLFVTLAPKIKIGTPFFSSPLFLNLVGQTLATAKKKTTFLRRISQSSVVSRHETIRKRLDS